LKGFELPVEVGLELYAEKDVVLPFYTGHISRGLLLHILRQVDPRVSQEMHELNVAKPYSVTPLQFKSKIRGEKGYLFDSAFPCRVKFRFLRDEFSKYLIDYFGQKNTVTIIDTQFHIASMAIRSKDYLELENEAKAGDSFRLCFRTPTYLSSLGTSFHCLWPEPTKIFLNLIRLWNLYTTGKRFGKDEYVEYRDWLGENVGVAEHQLKTRLFIMGRKKAAGFVGWTTYVMKEKNRWNKATCMLAKFAEYSNIGGNKTAGYGVTKCLLK
jgi:CRISPR-associated endoribonuclease Cas6